MAAVAQHREIAMGTYMGLKITKHQDVGANGLIERKFFIASDERVDWINASDTFTGIKEKIDEHLRVYEQIKKQGTVKKFVLYRAVAETQNKKELQEGFGFNWYTDLEVVDEFDSEEKALKALKCFKTSVDKIKGMDVTGYRMTEYAVIEELHSKWSDNKEEIRKCAFSKNNFKKAEGK